MAGQDGNNNPFANVIAIPHINDLTRICCIGSGPLAILTTYVLSERFPQKHFTLIDVNDRDIEIYRVLAEAVVNLGLIQPLPFHEPQFDQLFIAKHAAAQPNVSFRVRAHHANEIAQAHVVIICSHLELLEPKLRYGAFADVDLRHWEKAVRLIREHAINRKLVIDFSPFPPLDENHLGRLLGGNPGHILVSNPQFFSLGTAIQELTNPAIVVVALKSDHPLGYLHLVRLFYDNMGQAIILDANFRAAELSRLATSCCFGVMAVFSNMLATVSRELRVNIEDVMAVTTSDPIIGNVIFNPSTAVGGPNMIRDLSVLQFIAHHYHLDSHSKLIRNVIAANEERMITQIRDMQTRMASFKGKTISVFGFAFKEGTSDISYSPSVFVCKRLYKAGCNLRIYDPLVANLTIRSVFPEVNRVAIMGKTLPEMQDACNDSHALCFFTRSVQFQQMNWDMARQSMVQNTQVYVFDCAHNGFDDDIIVAAGLNVGFPRFD